MALANIITLSGLTNTTSNCFIFFTWQHKLCGLYWLQPETTEICMHKLTKTKTRVRLVEIVLILVIVIMSITSFFFSVTVTVSVSLLHCYSVSVSVTFLLTHI